MAKKKEETKTSDFLKIKNCKVCYGKPITSNFNAPPFKGIKCETCFEIVSYDKIKTN